MEFRFQLQKYNGMNSKHECPKCRHKKTFTLYIDSETDEILAPHVGKCDREHKCGYHYPPRLFFESNNNFEAYEKPMPDYSPLKPKPISYFDKKYLESSLSNLHNNNFIKFLYSKFDGDKVSKAIGQYNIGTANYWNGDTVFWYLDKKGRIRGGKVMLYDKNTGKRMKNKYGKAYIHSMRSILVNKGEIDSDFNQRLGFFGEQLLSGCLKPVYIVESEKTAIIASIVFPQFIWLATGSRGNLTEERCKVLKGRDVILCPDNDAFEDWSNRAMVYHFDVLNLVKDNLSDPKGDLADFILDNLESLT